MSRQIKYGEKTLVKTKYRLQKFCHNNHIHDEDYDGCPDNCHSCDSPADLDLHTSLAWVLAGEIENFLEQMEVCNNNLEEFYFFLDEFRGCPLDVYDLESEWDNMESSFIDLQETFDELNSSYMGAVTIRAALNYHANKYKKLWGYTSNGSNIMRTAWNNCRNAIKKCRTILNETDRKIKELREKEECCHRHVKIAQ